MRKLRTAAAVVGVALMVGGLAVPSAVAAPPAGRPWVASWTASPSDSLTPFDATFTPTPTVVADQTFRMVVTPHTGGSLLRLHLSNRFGSAATTFGRVTIAPVAQAGGAAVDRPTPVRFAGRDGAIVAAGDDVVSDPVSLRFSAFEPLAVSMYLPGLQGSPTKHWNANATSYYSPAGTGDQTGASSPTLFLATTEAWMYVDELDVQATPVTHTVVAFGDSITDGFVAATPASIPVTRAVADKNGRYPDDLQRRLTAARLPISVANAGISANRLVTDGEPSLEGPSGVQRFKEDALDLPGVTCVVVLEGINDLGIPPATTTPIQLIGGYEQVIAMAHAAGKRIILGTILPASNAVYDGTLLAPNSERYREQVNAWIRSQHLSDGVVDFAAALQDPANPTVLNPAYSGPDHLHPNLAGYQVMADTIDLRQLAG